MSLRRLLFASTHCLLDPSSGAALATRDLLELLAARGVDCRAVCGGVLDYDRPTRVASVLDALGAAYAQAEATLAGAGRVPVLDVTTGGVRMTITPWRSSRGERAPDPTEARAWLALAQEALTRFRPDILLTYGGHPVGLELSRQARRLGIPAVFHLHNFGYTERSAFADCAAVLVPSEYSRRHHARALGLDATAIPYPLRFGRVVAEEPVPEYVTFVNPQTSKGAAVFARIALEMQARRPEIPLLVVEGRGRTGGLADCGLDLSGLENLHTMANTPEPKDFYKVSRAVLVPSLWRESFGRVAAEGMANGLPVLASDRGALPETLGDAGFVLPVPDHCTPAGGVPTARDVRAWTLVIERLWDDAAFESRHRELACTVSVL